MRLKPESERQAAPNIVTKRNIPQALPRATDNSEALVVRAAGSSLYTHFQHIRLSTMLCNFLSSVHLTTLFSRNWSPMTKESGLTIWRHMILTISQQVIVLDPVKHFIASNQDEPILRFCIIGNLLLFSLQRRAQWSSRIRITELETTPANHCYCRWLVGGGLGFYDSPPIYLLFRLSSI